MYLEKKHFIILAICLLAILFLWICKNNGKEHFSVIQEWPYLPPNNWNVPQAKKWTPWWYEQNEDAVYQSVPSIANYDTNFYRFPTTNCIKPQSLRTLHPLTKSTCGTPVKIPFATYDINSMSNISDVNPNGMDGIVVERFSSQIPNEDNIEKIGCGGCMRKLANRPGIDINSYLDGSCNFDTIEGFGNIGSHRMKNLSKLFLLVLIVCCICYLINKNN